VQAGYRRGSASLSNASPSRTIEHAHVEAGGLPSQDWALRVTLVYRRDGSRWRLAHRHADPLANPISVTESAALGRGEHATR
jgi:hypothetical protein